LSGISDIPRGRKTPALSDTDHFRESFKVQDKPRKHTELEFARAESMFYEHARQNRRRSGVIKVIK